MAQISLLASLACFSIALPSMLAAFTRHLAYTSSLQDEFEEILLTPQEPRTSDKNLGLVAAALSGMGSPDTDPPEGFTKLVEAYKEVLKAVAEKAQSRPRRWEWDRNLSAALRQEFQLLPTQRYPTASQRGRELVYRAKPWRDKGTFGNLEGPFYYVLEADREKPRSLDLVLPSATHQGLPFVSGSQTDNYTAAPGTHLFARSHEPVPLSPGPIVDLEVLVGCLLQDLLATLDAKELDAKNVYYISPHSVLAFWRESKDDKIEDLLPPHILWAAGTYFREAQKLKVGHSEAGKFQKTPIYVDYGAAGLITTWSFPLSMKLGSREVFLGIVAWDAQINPDTLWSRLEGSKFLGSLRCTISEVSTGIAIRGAEPLSEIEDVEALRRDLEERLNRVALQGDRGFKQRATILPSLESGPAPELSGWIGLRAPPTRWRTAFVVPVLPRDGKSFEAAIVWPLRPGPPARVLQFAGCSLLAGILSLVLLATAFHLSKAVQRGESTGALLRNLQAGVLKVGKEEQITAANDRAEQLLGVWLPKFGAQRVTKDVHGRTVARRTTVEDLIESLVVMADEDGNPSDLTSFAEIQGQRKGFRPSRYFAKLRVGPLRGVWVLISGTPVRGGGEQWHLTTFALIQEVSTPLKKNLERIQSAGKES